MRFSTQITWLFKTSRWTDVWMFYSTLFLLRSNAYLKLTDEQMFGCLPKIKSDFLLRSHDCLKPPDEQMFRCFQHCPIRYFAQSIWLFKTCRWTDVWMFTNDSMRFSTQITWPFKTSRWTDVWMFSTLPNKMFCSEHMTVQNLQMNRCLDVFIFCRHN